MFYLQLIVLNNKIMDRQVKMIIVVIKNYIVEYKIVVGRLY